MIYKKKGDKMKVVMIFDQIQAGAGTKDDKMVPLAGKKEALGPAVMMQPMLKEIDARVVACLYCGTGTYATNKAEVSRKLCAMVKKINPDIVMCGPAFNYADYAVMAAEIAYDINTPGSAKQIPPPVPQDFPEGTEYPAHAPCGWTFPSSCGPLSGKRYSWSGTRGPPEA